MSNWTVLDHERVAVYVDEAKQPLVLYGCPWCPWNSSPTHPDKIKETQWIEMKPYYGRMLNNKEGIDILLTHIPPFGVLDYVPLLSNWGSSIKLRTCIEQLKPRAHLFGHIHSRDFAIRYMRCVCLPRSKLFAGVQWRGFGW